MPAPPIRLDGALVKRETVYRTDAVPVVGTDALKLAERLYSTIRIAYAWENLLGDATSGWIGPTKPAQMRGRHVQLDLAWLVRGAGADVPPEADPCYRACGCAYTDGTLLHKYAQASQLHDSCTVYAYAAGFLYKVVGCRGTLRIPFAPGVPQVHRFRMLGFLGAEPAPAALPGGLVFDANDSLAGVGLGLTITPAAHAAWIPRIIRGEFNQGVEPQRMDDGNDNDGIEEFAIGDANPVFTLSARVPRDATGIWDQAAYDPFADSKNRTKQSIALTQGSTQWNRCKFTATDAYLQPFDPAEHQRFAAWDLSYVITDVSWEIQFD